MQCSKSVFRLKTLSKLALPFLVLLPSQVLAEPSPCGDALQYLEKQYSEDEQTRKAFDTIYQGLQDLPLGYSYNSSSKNPWKMPAKGKGIYLKMLEMFEEWCVDLPEIEGTSDNALDPILYFAWLYYKNPAGQDFVQGRDPANSTTPLATGSTFLDKWNTAYRNYMDSKASAKVVPDWLNDPRIEIEDYQKSTPEEYPSWNSFFARNLKTDKKGNYPSRPVTMPEREYVIVSPTDCIMNPLVQVVQTDVGEYERQYIDNPFQLDTVLDVKRIPISVNDMLGTLPQNIKDQFNGGTGLACVLMPNTYHHFHSPVDGTVVHAEVVETGTPGTPSTFGYPDFPNWVPPTGDVGRPGTDFSQFQAFQRGVIVVEVEYDNLPGEKPARKKGYVASVPVGLDSVGSVVLNKCGKENKETDQVNCFRVGGKAEKGKTKFGNFFFGGSLDILLFSKGMVSPAVQTRMGNQIGIINIGSSPKSPWSLD
ncbi:MAG: phosphatidylserine decarboxylase [Candidatus Electrothrix sp. AW1]|nr:phosphatidylserine decarboxylase [Candidatus Electrothrix sp. AX1]MCI5178828.1 phosphatidylserine decarboxylase [Candidatus Electrothrix gigas]MCI5182580.1 phosphatidylserine decarboxylase [Candidatus Electrothrix gigas]